MHFLLLIVFNNSIDTLGPDFITDDIFVAIFSSLADQMPHISSVRFKHDEPEPNSKIRDQIRGILEQKH